jgi:centrin-3
LVCLFDFQHPQVALRALDFPVRKADVVALLSQATGQEQVEQVSYDIFESIVANKICNRQPIDKYKRAFRLLDVDQNGAIDFKALKAVVSHLQDVRIDDAELREMIQEFDYDRDGAINEEEFLAIMQAYDE